MNDGGKSDSRVVPAKLANKAGQPVAELVEERRLAKGNTGQPALAGTWCGPGRSHPTHACELLRLPEHHRGAGPARHRPVAFPAPRICITAAHCVTRLAPSQFVFVPGYQNGKAPYGVWSATRVVVDQAWSAAASPDDDVAFLTVSKPGATASLQSVTGAERLGVGQRAGQLVQVTGYPNGAGTSISCLNRAVLYSPTQLEFDCDGYGPGHERQPRCWPAWIPSPGSAR